MHNQEITLDFILSGWRRSFKPGELLLLSFQIKALIQKEKLPYIEMISMLLEDGNDSHLSETAKRDASNLIGVDYIFNNDKR